MDTAKEFQFSFPLFFFMGSAETKKISFNVDLIFFNLPFCGQGEVKKKK